MKKLRSVVSVILAALLVAVSIAVTPERVGAQCSAPPAGIVSWWPGDGNARDSVGSSHGVLRNGAAFTAGKVRQAFSFDGVDDYVELPDNFFPYPTSGSSNVPFSFEAWFKTTSGGVILGQQAGEPFDDQLLFAPGIYVGTDGKLYVQMFWQGSESPAVSTSAVNDGVFHHVGVTYDGSTQVVYLDGALMGSQPFGQQGYAATYHYQFGTGWTNGWPGGNGGWFSFNGLLDEPTLYNRALTASEVQTIYNAGADGKCGITRSVRVVTNTNNSGIGSLRAAITFANTRPGTLLKFNIPLAQGTDIDASLPGGDAAPDVFVIQPTNPLPQLTGSGTYIDGASEAIFLGIDANPRGPEIVLNGASAGTPAHGLAITAPNCVINRLTINGFTFAGVSITGAAAVNNKIKGCYLGTDPGGGSAMGNSRGVFIEDADSNIIGGTTAAERNLISGNIPFGIQFYGNSNTVQGNYIGTDRTGKLPLANGLAVVAEGRDNLIGGVTTGERNIISANSSDGVHTGSIDGTGGNKIQGNYIGTDITGTKRLGNGGYGVVVFGTDDIIGGTVAGARNLISGNGGRGILLGGAGAKLMGNYIGTDVTGTRAIGNGYASGNGYEGVSINGNRNVIGGTAPGARNVISGNRGNGIVVGGSTVDGVGATGNLIQGNYIGTNAAGTKAVGNGGHGVEIYFGPRDTVIGGLARSSRNVISGNPRNGIFIHNETAATTVQNNYIGTDAGGTQPIPNRVGITIANGARDNIIGTPGAGNRVAFNLQAGVRVVGSGSVGNQIRGNLIFQNGGLGINLHAAGETANTVTPNDAGDADTGPNRLQNYPQNISAIVDGTKTTISFQLKSTPSVPGTPSVFAVDIYSSPNPDESGFGEGKIYRKTLVVQSDSNGDVSGGFELESLPGQWFSMTATDLQTGDTSEFSEAIQAVPPPPSSPTTSSAHES